MNPVVLHVVRPFETEAEFLENEAWTIDARGMLLVDQLGLDADTAVVFDVALATGTKVIRAEGRAVGYLAATSERPGGLRIRFRRFGAQTKAFIDRAVLARESKLSSGMSLRPPPKPSVRPKPLPISESPGLASAEARPSESVPSPLPAVVPVRAVLCRDEPSGVHARPIGPVETPVNRDELLERLRAWSREKSVGSSANASQGS